MLTQRAALVETGEALRAVMLLTLLTELQTIGAQKELWIDENGRNLLFSTLI